MWRNLFVNHPQGKYDGKLTKLATAWKEPDDVLEALFALSRKAVENEPLKIFMAISDIDRNRPKPLAPATVDRLAREYHNYGSQYPLFSDRASFEHPSLLFLDQMVAISKAKDRRCSRIWRAPSSRWSASGRSWCGSRAFPKPRRTKSSPALSTASRKVKSNRELFDAGRNGVKLLLAANAPVNDLTRRDA